MEGEELLGEGLVLREVGLAGAAAGVLEPEQVEEPLHGDVAEHVLGEHLHQIEDEVGPPSLQAGEDPLYIGVNAEDGHLVALPA